MTTSDTTERTVRTDTIEITGLQAALPRKEPFKMKLTMRCGERTFTSIIEQSSYTTWGRWRVLQQEGTGVTEVDDTLWASLSDALYASIISAVEYGQTPLSDEEKNGDNNGKTEGHA